jgi:hypothetical protein
MEDGMGGYVACVGEIRSAYSIFIGNPERKRPLGGPMKIILGLILGN